MLIQLSFIQLILIQLSLVQLRLVQHCAGGVLQHFRFQSSYLGVSRMTNLIR